MHIFLVLMYQISGQPIETVRREEMPTVAACIQALAPMMQSAYDHPMARNDKPVTYSGSCIVEAVHTEPA